MCQNYPEIEFSEVTELEKIGRGAFGTVYKAKWKDKFVAVKEFFFTHEGDQQLLEKEIRQSFRIGGHPNIVDVYGLSFKNSHTYLLLEYAHGGPLHRVLFGSAKSEYKEERAISWMYQCAQAVAFLHATKPKPLLHRDLKPANLLLTDNYETLKICDFGTLAELKTTMTDNTGSVAWMAPEVFNNKKYTERCDVFSFGIVLWEVLAREEYFRKFETTWAIPECVRNGRRPEVKDEWPHGLQLLMTCCWDANPSNRPSMNDVVISLKNHLELHGNEGGAENREITPFSSATLGYPYEVKLDLTGSKIVILERLTSSSILNEEYYKMGKFGITYKARSTTGNEIVALKAYASENYLLNLTRWGVYDKMLNNQTQFLKVFATHSYLESYWELEYAKRGSLYKIVHGSSKPFYFEALFWLIQCAKGIEFLHSNNLCANMLTSRNLFIDGRNKLKMGLLPTEEQANYLKSTYKSAGWMAPEVHKEGKYSSSSDVYSLGIVIWEVIHCEIPFHDENPYDIAQKVRKGIRPPEKDELLRKLLDKCWKTKPSNRAQIDKVLEKLETMFAKNEICLSSNLTKDSC